MTADRLLIAVGEVPVDVRLGVPARERARRQRIVVSVRLTRPAPNLFGPGDRIGQTLDYDELIAFIREEVPAREPFVLVEAVAEAVATHALDLGGAGARVEVTVAKPAVLEAPAHVAVTLIRERAP